MRNRQNLSLHILRLVRDGEASTCRELHEALDIPVVGTLRFNVQEAVTRLCDAGVLSVKNTDSDDVEFLDTKLSITKRWRLIQDELGISLKTLITMNDTPSMLVRPLLGKPNRSHKHDIFVVMPFRDHLEPIYTDCICHVASSLRLRVARGDDWASDHFIVSNIWDAICSARLVVAASL